jgi:arylsulfatase A-like enzyme
VLATEYATTALTNDAIAWTHSQRGPWLLWLAYNAPHTPFHAPPAALLSSTLPSDAASIARDAQRDYFAAAEAMDREIGRLLASLSDSVRRSTLIVFMGDNGTPQRVMQSPFTRQRGKSTVYQGGVHVPLVVAGAGVSRRGEREDALVSTVDVFATIARVATGTDAAATDGVSFAGAFTNARFAGRSHIHTEAFTVPADANSAWAVRDAQYKLIHFASGREELYDLTADPFEQRNLLATVTDETRAIAVALRATGERMRTSPPGAVTGTDPN